MDPLAPRVARRFVAELLTKQWLMGVRRGWLSLLNPTLHDFHDVFSAIHRLLQFVDNLREQILNVRQVVYKEKAVKALDKVTSVLKDKLNSAQHWERCYNGAVPGGPNERDRKDGEYMLNLYRNNFVGALDGSKPARGSGGRHRPAPITEFFDDALKIFYAEAKELEERVKNQDEEHPVVYADSVFREFDMGGVKVIVVDPKHNGQRIRAYVEYIDKVHQDIKRKGFGKVWYGVFFLMSDSYEKLSKEDQEAYSKAGYKNMESRAGTYHSGPDIIRIMAPPSSEIIDIIAHELGHRYWYKVMSGGQRARFESLIEGDWSKLHAILINHHLLSEEDFKLYHKLFQKVESGHDLSVDEKKLVTQKFKELGISAGVPLVSDYASSRPTEAFAEVFERYVTEKGMTRDQVESFRSVLASKILLMPEDLRAKPTELTLRHYADLS